MKTSLLSDDILLISGQHLDAEVLSDSPEYGAPYLTGPTDFASGNPNASRFTREGRAFCERDDLLIVVKGSGTGAVFTADGKYAIGRQLMAVRAQNWNASFVGQLLRASSKRFANAATGLIPGISRDIILDTPVLAFSIHEQCRIADILGSWDRAIEMQQKLLTAKTTRLRTLRHQLLTGAKRFPEFKQKWRAAEFGDFLTESRAPGNTGLTARRLTLKLYGKGLLPKSDDRRGSGNTNYFTRKTGQFIYSKLDFLNGAFAIVPPGLDGYETTADVPAFDVDSKQVNAQWLLAFTVREEFYHTGTGYAAGGRKARRVNPDQFFTMLIKLPTLAEQTRIATFLNACQREIDLLTTQLEALKQQKRGMMQKLLTGEVRVKV